MTKARRRSRSGNVLKQMLYDYPEAKRALAEREADAISGRSGEQSRRGNLPGDPTGRAGAALAEDGTTAALEWHVKTVERALERVRQECAPYIAQVITGLAERVYFRRDLTLTGYSIQADRPERTIRRWHKILLTKLDEEARG